MTHPDSGNDSVNDPDDKIAIDAVLLGEGRHPDPFTVLGRHGDGLSLIHISEPTRPY